MPPMWIVLLLLPIFGEAARFECRGRILGAYYADAKSGCKAFHVCVRVAGGGIKDFRFFCPPGTLFHQEAQTCTDWGDDDPLACPADIYDGQFDLYKIGSGYDTKKLSSPGNREEEAEFGLQRAETGDRRSQNNGPASDLRAAHSSDFFSGHRDRGRDEPASPSSPAPSDRPSSPSRQSFRRPTTRVTPQSTLDTPAPNSTPGQYETKRKLVRKRPIYVSTSAPTTYATASPTPQQQQQNFNQPPTPKQIQPSYNQLPPKQNFNQQPTPQNYNQQQQTNQIQISFNQQPQPKPVKQNYNQPPQNFNPSPQKSAQIQNYEKQKLNSQSQQNNNQQKPTSQSQQNYNQQQQYFNQRPASKPTTLPPANVPPQYKDEYVEVPRVTPKQTPNRYYPNNPTSAPFPISTFAPKFNKKEGLAELYNYDAQSTPAFNVQQSSSQPFKVKNSFVVSDTPEDFARTNYNSNRGKPTTLDYNTSATRAIPTSTTYKNINQNSVSYESENFVSWSGNKQNYYNNYAPTTSVPTTTYYTTTRADSSRKLNTVAYNTNIALNTIQPANYVDGGEDDGQYRPPPGEDDGQYRPELYERELLSGAHSLNIAASGNRLPDDSRKTNVKSQQLKGQTSAPRPFRPAPTPTASTTTRAPETTTTYIPSTQSTQRTFDYFQTYTTTSRPETVPPTFNYSPVSSVSPVRSTQAPRAPEPRPTPRAPEPRPTPRAPTPSSAPARPSSNPPHLAKPAQKQEDASYDYAYYDSDPGYSEYDHIEEFGKTKTKTRT